MTTENTTLPAPQFLATHALAEAHGHEWGGLDARTALAINEVGGLHLLARVVRARNGDIWPGIDCPFVDAGTVHHTTGTGRLRWDVEPDGYVRLWISRPGPETGETDAWSVPVRGPAVDVLCAEVGAPDESGVPGSVTVAHVGGEFHERHIAALLGALGALAPHGYGRDEFMARLDLACESVRGLAAPEPAETPAVGALDESPVEYAVEDDAPRVVVTRRRLPTHHAVTNVNGVQP